jgi:hypothetical protein
MIYKRTFLVLLALLVLLELNLSAAAILGGLVCAILIAALLERE